MSMRLAGDTCICDVVWIVGFFLLFFQPTYVLVVHVNFYHPAQRFGKYILRYFHPFGYLRFFIKGSGLDGKIELHLAIEYWRLFASGMVTLCRFFSL